MNDVVTDGSSGSQKFTMSGAHSHKFDGGNASTSLKLLYQDLCDLEAWFARSDKLIRTRMGRLKL